MPLVSFEKTLCSWKCNYKPPPASLHRWQWQVVVIQKQGARKQKLENVSSFLCLGSGNPSLLICLSLPAHHPQSQAHPAEHTLGGFIQLHGNCVLCDSNPSRSSHCFFSDRSWSHSWLSDVGSWGIQKTTTEMRAVSQSAWQALSS